MPQLWTETFVSQYFWLMVILLTFYFFIATQVIPSISNAIKARQLTDNTDVKATETNFANDKASNLFVTTNKLEIDTTVTLFNSETIQNEWLSSNPENDNQYWTETSMSEESKQQLDTEEDGELSLEDFLQSEDTK